MTIDPVFAAIQLTALATGLVAAALQPPGPALGTFRRVGLAFAAFAGSMIGAKLPYGLADLESIRAGGPFFLDGKTILWGMMGAYAGVELGKRILGIRFRTGDTLAVPAALAIGVGRFGCLRGGCCYGVPTNVPWAMHLHDGQLRHPTQIYEAIFHFTMAGVMILLRRRGIFKTHLVKFYFLSYFAYRFATEFIRPEPVVAVGLTFYQFSALAFAAIIAMLWFVEASREQPEMIATRP